MNDEESLAQLRIENSRKRVAHALNLLETVNQELNWACKSMEWNDDIVYQVGEAAEKLGYVLATLTRWNDPDQNTSEI